MILFMRVISHSKATSDSVFTLPELETIKKLKIHKTSNLIHLNSTYFYSSQLSPPHLLAHLELAPSFRPPAASRQIERARASSESRPLPAGLAASPLLPRAAFCAGASAAARTVHTRAGGGGAPRGGSAKKPAAREALFSRQPVRRHSSASLRMRRMTGDPRRPRFRAASFSSAR